MINVRFSIVSIYDLPLRPDTGASFTLFDYRCDYVSDWVALNDFFYATWMTLLSPALTYRTLFIGSAVYDLDGAGWPIAMAEDLTKSDRPSGVPIYPSQNCIVIKRRDGNAGRAGRGRIFISCPNPTCMALLQNGDLVDPTSSALLAIADEMKLTLTAPDGAACVPIIWHRSTSTGTPVVATAIQEILCSRRSKRTWRFDDVPQL